LVRELPVGVPDWTYEHLPHVMEPLLAGGCENIINVGKFWNSDILLGRREEINNINTTCQAYHTQATRYLAAAGAFLRDIESFASGFTDYDKIDRFVKSFAQREFGVKENGSARKGKKHVRLLSAVTPEGTVFFQDTLSSFAEKIFVFEDEFSAASGYFMKKLEGTLLNNGMEIISCPSPMFPQNAIDQIIIPSLNIAVTVKNRIVPFKGEAYRTYHSKRFTDTEGLAASRQKSLFCKKAVKEFVDEAASSMKNALDIHDRLEEIYKNAMDFVALNDFSEELLGKIL